MLVLFVIFDIILILLTLFLALRIARKHQGKNKKLVHQIDRTVYAEGNKAELLSGTEQAKDSCSIANVVLSEPSVEMSIEERKGFLGEQSLYNQIKQVQDVGAKVIWGCWLKFPNRTITQVDILLIWKSGIFVIESKNWTGCEVSGLEDDENWSIKRYDWKGDVVSLNLTINPIKQNAIHVDCVRKRIGNLAPVYSIIAFNDSCKLVGVQRKTNDTAVINYSELRQTIADFHISAKKDCLSVESVQILSDFFITMSNEVTEEERSLHNTQIRCLQREKTPVISAHC